MQIVSFDQFAAVDIRAGTVVRAEAFPEARKPAIKVWVDFGPELGVRQTSAQITVHYTPETLPGRRVAGCINLGTKKIAGFSSEFLLLGFPDENGTVVLMGADKDVPNGGKLF